MIELIICKSAVAKFCSGSWVDEQDFLDDANSFGEVLLIPIDPFQIVKHPGQNLAMVDRIKAGTAELKVLAVQLGQLPLTALLQQNLTSSEGVDKDFDAIMFALDDEVSGHTNPFHL